MPNRCCFSNEGIWAFPLSVHEISSLYFSLYSWAVGHYSRHFSNIFLHFTDVISGIMRLNATQPLELVSVCLWLQSSCTLQILKQLFNLLLSVSVSAAARLCLKHVTDRLASLLGEIPLVSLGENLPQHSTGLPEVWVRAGWGANAACMSQQWAQTANWFGEIQWPQILIVCRADTFRAVSGTGVSRVGFTWTGRSLNCFWFD